MIILFTYYLSNLFIYLSLNLYIFKDINNILRIMLENIFNLSNLFRIIFYTPVFFLGSVLTSIVYDYVTYKKDDNKKLD